jgi:2-hydroxy-3-keto-5-methylthiopentenyl-1-phosphate phosphatase
MITEEKKILALVYDFDGTLSKMDMQNYYLIPNILKMEVRDFWQGVVELRSAREMDHAMSYTYYIIEKAKENGVVLTKDIFLECAKNIEFYPGVEGWFQRINNYAYNRGIIVEHYVTSLGIKEIIEGTSIAHNFKRIYANEFLYKNGEAVWLANAVNFTNKTQYLYRISKQTLDIRDTKLINKKC